MQTRSHGHLRSLKLRVFRSISRAPFLIVVLAFGLSIASAQTSLDNCFTEPGRSLGNGWTTNRCLAVASNPPRPHPTATSATTSYDLTVGDLLVGIPGPAEPAGAALTASGSPGNVAVVAVTTNGPPTAASFLSTPGLPTRSGRIPPRKWLVLSIAQHGAATFDAWSTRQALSTGQYQELNPTLRPFAGNSSIYAAIQVGPLIFDYVSARMMTSQHAWIRHAWWIPQALSTAASLGSGAYNLGPH